jgi:hypothetical protein
LEGTPAANTILAQIFSTRPAVAAAPVARPVQVSRPIAAAAPASAPPPAIAPQIAIPAIGIKPQKKQAGEYNLGLGILGTLLGAALGVGLMYGFYEFAGFRFPLLGIGIGALTGLGAKLLAKGTDNLLGIISGGVALVAVVGTLYLMYGVFPLMSIISVIISVSIAYQIASG